MARTAVSPQTLDDDGLNLTYSAVTVDGDVVPGGGNVVLHVKNASGSSINVTVQTGKKVQERNVVDTTVAVPAGQDRFIGPFDRDAYNEPSGTHKGKVLVDYSSQASVTRAAFYTR